MNKGYSFKYNSGIFELNSEPDDKGSKLKINGLEKEINLPGGTLSEVKNLWGRQEELETFLSNLIPYSVYKESIFEKKIFDYKSLGNFLKEAIDNQKWQQ